MMQEAIQHKKESNPQSEIYSFSNNPSFNDLNEIFVPSPDDRIMVMHNLVLSLIMHSDPSYTFEIVAGRQIKCIADYEGRIFTGIALSKKEVKEIVSIQFINKIIQDECYSVTVKDYMKKNFNSKFVKRTQDIEETTVTEQFLKKKRNRDESDKKAQSNHKSKPKQYSPANNVAKNSVNMQSFNLLNEQEPEPEQEQELMKKVNKQSFNTMKYNIEIELDLHLYKWERCHLIDELTQISLTSFESAINQMLLKFKLNSETKVKTSPIGSQASLTLRNNAIQLDYCISSTSQMEVDDSIYTEFIDSAFIDINLNNWSIDSFPNDHLVQITSKNFGCSIRFIRDSNKANLFNSHALYLSNNNPTIEDIILIKALKAWRRKNSLLFFLPEIIEYLVLLNHNHNNNQRIGDRLISFYRTLSEIDKTTIEWSHLATLNSELLSNEENVMLLINAGKKALNSIEGRNYDELII